MKTTIKITGIIWTIVCFLAALILILVGAVILGGAEAAAQAMIDELIAQGATDIPTLEELVMFVQLTGVVLLVVGGYLVAGGVLSIVLTAQAKNEKLGKGAGIALGIVSFVFGAELPAVFFVIDSAISRK